MIIGLDTETALSMPGLAAPPLSCGSFGWLEAGEIKHKVLGARETLDLVTKHLRDKSVTFVGHNIAYDFAVICAERPELIDLVFQAHADDRIRDTDYRERLIANALGEWDSDRDVAYNLETLAMKRCGIKLDKTTFRHGYGKLINVPLNQWEPGAIKYAADDVVATLNVYLSQAAEADDYRTSHPDHAVWHEHHACRKAWALYLMRCWGVRTDPEYVHDLEQGLLKRERELMKVLVETGILLKHKKKDEYTAKKKVIQARVEAAYAKLGKEPPRTNPTAKFPDGQIKTDGDTCEIVDPKTGDPVDRALDAYAEYVGVDKVLGNYVPTVKQGTRVPINAWWNPMVSSDRTSCSSPPWQQMPRVFGARQCVIPGEGLVFSSVDLDTIELKALANFNQETFGYSLMAERIREGVDLHTQLASRLLNIPYEEAKKNKSRADVKHARALAKAINFGFPGGMGAARFVAQARKGYGLHFTEAEAKAYKMLYMRENPEMVKFFAHVSQLTSGGRGTVETPGSKMLRGNTGYPDACNQHFQGSVAYGATDALFYVSWECYVDKGTALYGSRPVLFIHDEIICSHPRRRAHEASHRVAVVMCERIQRIFPHVPITASPALMLRWQKDAEAYYSPSGELLPWEYLCVKTLGEGLRSLANGASIPQKKVA